MNQQVSDTFKKLYFGKRTGVLTCESDSVKRAVYFQSGFVVGAWSNDPEDRLGEVMIREGRITREQIEDASQFIKSGWKLGEILAELGFIEEHEIEAFVRKQLLDITCMQLVTPPRRLAFTTSSEVDRFLSATISVADILLEAVRRSPDSVARAEKLIEEDLKLGFPSDPLKRFQDVHLTPEDAFVLSRVDGTQKVADILSVSPVSDEETALTLVGLLEAGLIEPSGTGVAPPSSPSVAPASSSSATSPPAGAAPAPSPDPVLPERSEIEHGSESSSDDGPPIDTSQTIQHERREEQERAAIELLYQEIQFQDHWQVLNVERDCSASLIKEAFFRGAKKYHPDRFRSITEPEFQEKLSFVFRRFSEAYETLGSEAERESYEKLCAKEERYAEDGPIGGPSEGGATVMSSRAKVDEAAGLERRATEAFDSGDYWSCIELCRQCIDLAPDIAVHYNLLGRSLAKNPKWRKDAEKNLKIAMNLDPFNATFVLELAKFYEREGLHLRAQRALERAQSIDPSVQSEP